jgi:phage protein D
MIRRLFYISLGAFIAVWVMRKLQALHPNHVARRAATGAAGLLDRMRFFAEEALEAAAKRESELRAEVGLDSVVTRAGIAYGRQSPPKDPTTEKDGR